MFFGWEGVGLASYLLIGFWYKKKSANDAAIKAFVTNRVGDFGFALGIMALFVVFRIGGALAMCSARVGRPIKHAFWAFLGAEFNAIEPDRLPAVHWGDGQVGAVLPACLAAGRDGGPDTG